MASDGKKDQITLEQLRQRFIGVAEELVREFAPSMTVGQLLGFEPVEKSPDIPNARSKVVTTEIHVPPLAKGGKSTVQEQEELIPAHCRSIALIYRAIIQPQSVWQSREFALASRDYFQAFVDDTGKRTGNRWRIYVDFCDEVLKMKHRVSNIDAARRDPEYVRKVARYYARDTQFLEPPSAMATSARTVSKLLYETRGDASNSLVTDDDIHDLSSKVVVYVTLSLHEALVRVAHKYLVEKNVSQKDVDIARLAYHAASQTQESIERHMQDAVHTHLLQGNVAACRVLYAALPHGREYLHALILEIGHLDVQKGWELWQRCGFVCSEDEYLSALTKVTSEQN